MSRRTAMMGAIGVAGAAVVGCATEPSKRPVPAASATSPDASATTASPAPTEDPTPRWPLTGKVLKDPEDAQRIAVAVKVPDNKGEHPQMGLDKADIVYVELDGYPAAVGQSGTRLVPIYHTNYADAVNPVRSVRPVDVPMLSPITGIIGNTGGFGWVLKYFAEFTEYLEIKKNYMATKGTGSYSILSNRVRTLNGNTYYDRAVACHPEVLAKQTKKFSDGPQQNYLPWAASDDEVSTEVSGKPAGFVSVPWKQGNTYNMSYTYSAKKGRYLRSMPWGKHVLADGTRVSCDNVLIIKAKQVFGRISVNGKINANYAGHDEPIHDIVNSRGSFYYAHGGKYVTGTWSKGDVQEPFVFTLADGSPLKVAPGQTFIELPDKSAKIIVKE
ncbi:MAG: DUF3048 C-terminal domain-containing protein [Propionicimonas sp.]